jgi:UDP-glucose 4-epimerase
LAGGGTDYFNLGTNIGVSVRQVIAAVEKVVGQSLPLSVAPRRAGDPPFLVAGSNKARTVLSWEPRHDLDSIVRTAWRWTQAHRG